MEKRKEARFLTVVLVLCRRLFAPTLIFLGFPVLYQREVNEREEKRRERNMIRHKEEGERHV